jgi:hypothetical protein
MPGSHRKCKVAVVQDLFRRPADGIAVLFWDAPGEAAAVNKQFANWKMVIDIVDLPMMWWFSIKRLPEGSNLD